jgi:predicted nucleic acid-binding protein
MNAVSTGYVLDSWALLALLNAEEPAASRVRQLLHAATADDLLVALSVINLGEIFYIVGRGRGISAAEQAVATIKATGLQILPADESAVLAAARLKAQHRIAYADAFAMAAAEQLGAVLVTGDAEIVGLMGTVQIEPLGRVD